MVLTDRFAGALAFAEMLHRDQSRKGSRIPYVAHLMATSATVLEWGGDEDMAIAALLHDAVEDQGGLETARVIRDRFGRRVAEIVLACTDSLDDPDRNAAWSARKRRHVEKLRTATQEVALVTAADKLHNATALVRDVRRDGHRTLERFNAGPDALVDYLRSVAHALEPHRAAIPLDELEEQIDRLEALVRTEVS